MSQSKHEAYEIENLLKFPEGTRREGLLSHVNSVDESHKSMAKILPRREKGGRTWREKRRGERLAAGSLFLFLCSVQRTPQERRALLFSRRHPLPLPLCFSSKPFSKD